MFVSLAGPTSPAYSCCPGVLTQSNTSHRAPDCSYPSQAYLAGLLVRLGVRTRASRHVYRSYVLTVTVSFLRRPTSPAYSAALASEINQQPRADSLIVRIPRRSYEPRVLVRSRRPNSIKHLASGPSPFFYYAGLRHRRTRASRRPDSRFSSRLSFVRADRHRFFST